MKILSWNLLHREGATVDQIAQLLLHEKPDLFLMQEVTRAINILPMIAGGHYHHQAWPGKRYGMAVWSAKPFEKREPLQLPFSKLPGSFPTRYAQVVGVNGITVANVHLSHGQVLNRRQLNVIAGETDGETIIMGDFNAVGPTVLKSFKDIGPRQPTHRARKLIPFRLDRCLARGLDCMNSKILHPHGSDHHPILVTLKQSENMARKPQLIL